MVTLTKPKHDLEHYESLRRWGLWPVYQAFEACGPEVQMELWSSGAMETTASCDAIVVRDHGMVERALAWGLTELTGQNVTQGDASYFLYGGHMVDVYDEQAQICCDCHDVVLDPDPYSGLPPGTVFVDGEGWQCPDCSESDPDEALRCELGVNDGVFGCYTTSDVHHLAEDAGWVVFDEPDDRLHRQLRERRVSHLVSWRRWGETWVMWPRKG